MSVQKIEESLKNVKYPGFTKSIIEYGFVKDIILEDDIVSIKLEITSSAPEVTQILKDDIKQALSEYKTVNIFISAPKAPEEKSNTRSGKNLLPTVKNVIMVSSGKGGVGKSTTTTNLAVAMAMQGKKVGLLDADIYGPNIPRMLGLESEKPEVKGDKLEPLSAYGIKMISMGVLVEEGKSLIWRGSMIMKVIEQLLRDVNWGELDVIFIDMPPGTGDAQLTLAQSVPVTAGVVVSTPQQVALDDTRRSLDMFKKLNIPIAGVVENMSGFICPETQKEYDIFGKGTTEPIAAQYDTKVLANMPIQPELRVAGDDGKPLTFFYPESETAKRYLKASDNLWEIIEDINKNGGADNSSIQPVPSATSACSTAAATNTQASSSNSSGGCCGGGCH
jgi:ATP-binding protein involved in chromosome partitioning